MNPVVHVLLATYNGERHLSQQWASLQAQQGVDVVVHVGDDGSTDNTITVLRRLAEGSGGAIKAVRWLNAPPRRSATRSFLQLLDQALRHEPAGCWFAFCDQDDEWLPGKLAAALAVLGTVDARIPALYGGRTRNIDEEGREGAPSPLFARPPCFRNALVQSIMGGNTMLMNRAAAELLATVPRNIQAHDWFSYQLVTGVGGFAYYDPVPHVRYRQHAANVVGSNLGWAARWRRAKRILSGDFRVWNAGNVAALQGLAGRLTAENREVLVAFDRARRAADPLRRAYWLRRSGVFRQPVFQQASLWLACLLRRI